MPNAYGAVVAPGLYTGLAPEAALAKWHAIRQKPKNQLTPEEQADIAGNMIGLSEQNPEAWRLVASGKNDNGQTRQIFDPMTGQWKDQEVKGIWSNPETWLQFGAGAGVAAPFVLGAIGGAAAGAVPSATTAGTSVAGSSGAAGMGGAVAAGAPAAAKSASSWLTGPTASLISTGIGAAGNIWATSKAAGAEADAARLSAEYYDKALAAEKEDRDYKRNQYNDYLSRLDPYAQTGYAANDRISRFLGQTPTARPVGSSQTPAAAAASAGARLVKMQGPDGSIRDIREQDVPHFQQLGAKVIANG